MEAATRRPSTVFDPDKGEFVRPSGVSANIAQPAASEILLKEITVEKVERSAGPLPIDFEKIRHALKLPDGARVADVVYCSNAPWTRAAKIAVEYPDGSLFPYFVKVGHRQPSKKHR